ncbi:MAG TPA: ABC transporter ATP-binding protein [Bdellovibrionales bacterium]|nr:MAG: hypothetical protein A2Z97_11485 [Bdellovibrionales bacterium GWB1_52_6]OFZ03877.1 MAG: hypothetical protein A2X97_15875 [Bdellovibrionales bacterium GWA1_52_35]OFZ40295.1 MAG: hypothetical protein A2070_11040 [Bdellovibrionales bacterium GWC1_52_8]HAR42324.1 ABC transporter ATP-binding protein [Bdellovibrionales bacterium]HCM39688.1 ABC transporter ATP-binding protein [Bdellovibrionales bacterium]
MSEPEYTLGSSKPIRILENGRSWILVRLIVNGMIQAGAAIFASRMMHLAFDRVIHKNSVLDWGVFAQFGLGLTLAALSVAWLRMVERIDGERMGQDFANQLRIRLFDHISITSVRSFQRRSKGSVLLRFIGDLKVLRQWISMGLARLIVATASTTMAIGGLAFMNVAMAISASVVIVMGCLLGFGWGKHLHGAIKESRRRQSIFAANVNEKISSIAVVQAFGQSGRERERIARQGEKLKDAMVMQARASAQLRSIGDATASLATALVLLVGAREVQAGRATAGTVVAAMSLVGLVTPLLRDLSSAFVLWHGASVSLGKIMEFINTSRKIVESPSAPDLSPGSGEVEFRSIVLGEILRGVSAFAHPGTRIAVIGPNGSGKSTLLSLTARLCDPDQGEILLDGQKLSEHSLASLRHRLGMVSPDLPLLRGPIEKNLRYRWPEAPEEELERVLKLCGVDEILKGLSEGIRTKITEGGASLSLGQRQRISLARALVGSPSLLLLDEADANLDPRSAAVLEKVMASYSGTVLMVSHNFDFVSTADTIWYMEGGTIVEIGTPQIVFAANGPAARFFRMREASSAG